MSDEIKTIQDVRDLLGKGHGKGGDPLQYLWGIHRSGKRKGEPSVLEKHYGPEYAENTPKYINESNLTFTFEEFSTDRLIEINHGITHRKKLPHDVSAPVVIVKFGDNYHSIDGARRITEGQIRASPRLSDRGPESNFLSKYAKPIMAHACRSRLFLRGVARRAVITGRGSWLPGY